MKRSRQSFPEKFHSERRQRVESSLTCETGSPSMCAKKTDRPGPGHSYSDLKEYSLQLGDSQADHSTVECR